MLGRASISTCVAAGLILASSFSFAASAKARTPAPVLTPAETAYLDGKIVQWHPVSGGPRQKLLRAGPWLIGARNTDKPRDGRLNLYIVTPGKQHHSDSAPQFDHNLIINALPKQDDEAAEWDVYLAIVLDPSLQDDITRERDLILARQQSFTPAADFKLQDIPGSVFLRDFLHFQAVEDLEGFRRSDGSLPRLILVPAKAMVRASVREEAPDHTEPGTSVASGDGSPAQAPDGQPAAKPAPAGTDNPGATPPQSSASQPPQDPPR